MTNDELAQHRQRIVEFVGRWGYRITPGDILPLRLSYKDGLEVKFPHKQALTDVPGNNGETSEYFLRDLVERAHANLWREVRALEMARHVPANENDDPESRFSDGSTIGCWAAHRFINDPEIIDPGVWSQHSLYEERLTWSGRISVTPKVHFQGEEMFTDLKLPASVLQSISMQRLEEIIELPSCGNAEIDRAMAKLFVMDAKERDGNTVFRVLDSCHYPMPQSDPSQLWRKVKEKAPAAVMIQFPPYGDPYAGAAENIEQLRKLLGHLAHEDGLAEMLKLEGEPLAGTFVGDNNDLGRAA